MHALQICLDALLVLEVLRVHGSEGVGRIEPGRQQRAFEQSDERHLPGALTSLSCAAKQPYSQSDTRECTTNASGCAHTCTHMHTYADNEVRERVQIPALQAREALDRVRVPQEAVAARRHHSLRPMRHELHQLWSRVALQSAGDGSFDPKRIAYHSCSESSSADGIRGFFGGGSAL